MSRSTCFLSLVAALAFLFGTSPVLADEASQIRFCELVNQGDASVVKAFIEVNKVDVNKECSEFYQGYSQTRENLFPLELAFGAQQGQSRRVRGLEVGELLLTSGANINGERRNGKTIFLSVFSDYPKDKIFLDFLKLAKKYKANFHTAIKPAAVDTEAGKRATDPFSDYTGMTALMILSQDDSFERSYSYALRRRNKDVELYEEIFNLVAKQSDLKAQDAYGRTALHFATDYVKPNIANLLIEAGLSSQVKDFAGLSSYDYAVSVGNKDLLQVVSKGKSEAEETAPSTTVAEAASSPEEQVAVAKEEEGSSVQVASNDVVPVPEQEVVEQETVVQEDSQVTAVVPKVQEQAEVQKPKLEAPASPSVRYRQATDAANRGNFSKAKTLWIELANSGHVESQYQLGRMYARGDGVSKDFSVARKYFEQAAKQNYAAANLSLGIMYLRGDGVAKDKAKAKQYLQMAKQGGDKKAESLLKNLT